MSPADNSTTSILSSPEYILDSSEGRIAMLLLNRHFGETIERITTRSSQQFGHLCYLQQNWVVCSPSCHELDRPDQAA
jgi:hypothetical protein